MKRILLATLAVILICQAPLFGQSLKKVETYYDPFTRTRIHEAYTTLASPPYSIHGIYKEWDQSGVLMTEAGYLNGKKHGAYKVFCNAGMRDLVGRENVGKLYSLSNYTNGKLNGLEQMYGYSANKAQIILQKAWVNGEQVKQETWTPEGLKTQQFQMNGVCFELYPDGHKKFEYTLKNGKQEGKSTIWFANGQTQISTNYKNGVEEGKHIEYFSDGQIELEATMVNGKFSGPERLFFEDGKRRKIITYDPVTFNLQEEKEFYRNEAPKFQRIVVSGNRAKSTYYDSLTGNKFVEQEELYDQASKRFLRDGQSLRYHQNGKINMAGRLK